jgi:hypothetical protein
MELTATTQSRLDRALGKSVTFRWTGTPPQGLLLRRNDAFAIPFSLLWGGFAIFWEANVSTAGVWWMMLWGLPFVLVGLYIIAGRFVVDAYFRAHTVYAVSDSAVYIVRDGILPSTTTLGPAAISPIEMRRSADGSGTLIFGSQRLNRRNGWEMWGFGLPPSFEHIPDVARVYALVEPIALER